MPRPCSRCARPVIEPRKTCMYCGGAPAEGAEPAAEVPKGAIDSPAAVARVLASAHEAFARGDATSAKRAVARILVEVHADDLKQIVGTMTESWLKGTTLSVGPARLGEASTACRLGNDAAVRRSWAEAARHYAEARAVYANVTPINPTMDLLALGAKYALEQSIRVAEREGRLEVVVNQASRLLTTPGRKAEAIPLFEKALEILAEDPDRPQDRERAEKIRRLIVDAAREGDVEGPAAKLPPRGALTAEKWDELGMQLLGEHPQQAKICFERAAMGDAENGRYWLHLATALIAVGAPSKDIISAYGLAVMRAPDELSGWVGLGAALQQASRFSEAVAAWDEAIARSRGADAPKRRRAFCESAALLLERGAVWDAKAWNAEGSRRYDAREWELADFAFDRAIALAPRYPGALMGKGIANHQWAAALRKEGNSAAKLRYRIALTSLEEALALRPQQSGLREVLEDCRKALADDA